MDLVKKKFIQIFIYIAIVSSGSFFLATYVEAARISDFLLAQKETIQEDKRKFILASAIANTFGEVEVFVQKDSLLSISIMTNEVEMNIDFYTLGYVKETHIDYALAVLITELSPSGIINSNDQDIDIRLTIQFNQPIVIRTNGNAQSQFEESFINLYTDQDRLAIFDVSALLIQYPSLQIQDMSFALVNANNLVSILYALNPQELETVQYQNIPLLMPTVTTFASDPSLFIDLNLRQSYRELDRYYFSHFSVYIVLVLSSGYLIFIRKNKPEN